MRYLIIGLGIYGSNLAVDLTRMGHEVIGADKNPSLVEGIKDYISTAYIIDSTDESALSVLPLKNVDIVIVAIGESFGASIRTVAILKKLGVPHIFARAIDQLHESILQGFAIERIITPEQRAASDLVNEMGVGGNIESMKIDDDNYILKFAAPDFFKGLRYSDLDFPHEYGLQLVAVTRSIVSKNILGLDRPNPRLIDVKSDPDATVTHGDIFVCLGTAKAYRAPFKAIAN